MASIVGYFNLNNQIPRSAAGLCSHSAESMITPAGIKPPLTGISEKISKSANALKPSLSTHHKQKAEYNGTVEDKNMSEQTTKEYSNCSIWEQVVLYIATVAGVLLSSVAMDLSSGGPLFIKITTNSVIGSMVVAFAIIPFAFGKLKLYQNVPFIFRVGIFVQHGVFWQVVFGSIGNAI